MVPAYAATLLKNEGYEVIWDDAIAEEKSYAQWLKEVERNSPDIMMIETKTPVVKKHWRIIEDVKRVSPKTKLCLLEIMLQHYQRNLWRKAKWIMF